MKMNQIAAVLGATFFTLSAGLAATPLGIAQEAYLKASNPGVFDVFGWAVAMSGDTLVLSAYAEDSSTRVVNGDESDNSATFAGAAYVFVRNGTNWTQQAYLKASNTDANDNFGWSAAISGDTIVVGAGGEASNATGVNGDQSDNSAPGSGAVYVFVRNGTNWTQQAYLKASNTQAGDRFGDSVAITGDTVLVGAYSEDSNATGVNGDQANNTASDSGAAYVFVRSGTNWTQQAYLKASNAEAGDNLGWSVAISDDTAIVGARFEASNSTGVNGNQDDNSAPASGAAYVFVRSGTNWSQQAYLKASNTGANDTFGGVPGSAAGTSVAIYGDTIAIGAMGEDSNATGINGSESNNSADFAGGVYIFVRSGTNWRQQAYLKASNTGAGDRFGKTVAVLGDALVVGAPQEDGGATGVNGDENNNDSTDSGAAYLFVRDGTNWTQQAYLKASNTGFDDRFGFNVAVSDNTVVVSGLYERSGAAGINGDESDDSVERAGAAYVFTGLCMSTQQLTLVPDGSAGYFLRFNGTPGLTFRVQRATELNGPWDNLDTQIAPASRLIEFHDTNPPTGQAFYRSAQP